ncbi:hypothetical protein ACI3PL_21690, partial [Lacticaseibacillus paracasei]
FIKINYLDEQHIKATNKSIINAENGKLGGRPKSENKPNGYDSDNPIETEMKPIKIREYNIKENKIKKEEISNNIVDRKLKFSSTLEPYLE